MPLYDDAVARPAPFDGAAVPVSKKNKARRSKRAEARRSGQGRGRALSPRGRAPPRGAAGRAGVRGGDGLPSPRPCPRAGGVAAAAPLSPGAAGSAGAAAPRRRRPRGPPARRGAFDGIEEVDLEAEYLLEMERLASSNMSEEKLRRAAGTRDLASVGEISLVLKSSSEFFANLGELLPNLRALTLDGSELKSLRDLGTGLRGLTFLSIADCGLCDLDGLAAFPALRELRLPQNAVTDLDRFFHHEALQVLDCSRNGCDTLMALEAVLGSKRKQKRDQRPLSAALLDDGSDPNSSRLTLDHAPFSGSALSLADPGDGAAAARPSSTRSTRPRPRRSAAGARGGAAPTMLTEWQAEARVSAAEVAPAAAASPTKESPPKHRRAPLPDVGRLHRPRTAPSLGADAPARAPLEKAERPATPRDRSPLLAPHAQRPPDQGARQRARGRARRAAASRGGAAVRVKPGRPAPADLSGSLAALDQWSEHAEAHDDGAVRFTRGPVARSPQRADRPAPAPAAAAFDTATPPPRAPGPVAAAGPRRRGLAARASSSSFAAPPPTEAPEEDPAPREDRLLGAATRLDDDTVVGMLKQPPKAVRHLRTRDGFRKFFSGMPRGRMEALLTAAFADQPVEEATARLHKRLQLLDDLLV
ncbi:hypothetical protein JL721_8286 [Aureococcus anophagefferens]|nr:hypothetical protein JL721_8286 [Aureococcus anophagefferens]